MEFALVELKFYVETFFNSNLHLDGVIFFWFLLSVADDELLFLGNTIVAAIDDNIDVVTKSDSDSCVALKLFLDSVELEVICRVVVQLTRWLEIAHDLKESRVEILILVILDHSDQLYSDSSMID